MARWHPTPASQVTRLRQTRGGSGGAPVLVNGDSVLPVLRRYLFTGSRKPEDSRLVLYGVQ